jgi:hypothetical protein
VALDHQVSKVENYIYVYHRYKVFNTTWAPCIAKLLKDDFSVVDIQYASATALTTTTIATPVNTNPTFGRLQICELSNFFVAAHNKDNT